MASEASSSAIHYTVARGVATIVLDRPEKLNAITFAMRDALMAHLEAAGADSSVRAVVLKGTGRAFTSGVDVTDRPERQDPSAHDAAADVAEIAAAARCWERLWELPKPVIVKAHGYCAGWGLEIALHADLVLSTPDCQFFYPSIRNGTGLPDSVAALYHLGPQWAKRLLVVGDTLDGRTAERIGLVLEALPEERLDAAVDDLARRACQVPPGVVAQSKALVNRAIDVMGRPTVQQLGIQANALVRQGDEAVAWSRLVREEGVDAAVAWRDRRRTAAPEPPGPVRE